MDKGRDSYGESTLTLVNHCYLTFTECFNIKVNAGTQFASSFNINFKADVPTHTGISICECDTECTLLFPISFQETHYSR